jgi:hypothetical protein
VSTERSLFHARGDRPRAWLPGSEWRGPGIFASILAFSVQGSAAHGAKQGGMPRFLAGHALGVFADALIRLFRKRVNRIAIK